MLGHWTKCGAMGNCPGHTPVTPALLPRSFHEPATFRSIRLLLLNHTLHVPVIMDLHHPLNLLKFCLWSLSPSSLSFPILLSSDSFWNTPQSSAVNTTTLIFLTPQWQVPSKPLTAHLPLPGFHCGITGVLFYFSFNLNKIYIVQNKHWLNIYIYL